MFSQLKVWTLWSASWLCWTHLVLVGLLSHVNHRRTKGHHMTGWVTYDATYDGVELQSAAVESSHQRVDIITPGLTWFLFPLTSQPELPGFGPEFLVSTKHDDQNHLFS